jgi:hypothetical protein
VPALAGQDGAALRAVLADPINTAADAGGEDRISWLRVLCSGYQRNDPG